LVEHRVLRKIFGTKMEEVTGKWAKLHVQDFFFQITRIKWKGHPVLMGITEMLARFPKENLQEEDQFEIFGKILA
jgi:hypothetical protein